MSCAVTEGDVSNRVCVVCGEPVKRPAQRTCGLLCADIDRADPARTYGLMQHGPAVTLTVPSRFRSRFSLFAQFTCEMPDADTLVYRRVS